MIHCVRGYIDEMKKNLLLLLILNLWPQILAVDEHSRLAEEYGRVKTLFLRVY